jgi:hypothetical protein
MLVYGASDTFKPEHDIEVYRLLGGGRADPVWHRENMATNLAILPDVTHYEMFCSPRPANNGEAVFERRAQRVGTSTGVEHVDRPRSGRFGAVRSA